MPPRDVEEKTKPGYISVPTQ